MNRIRPGEDQLFVYLREVLQHLLCVEPAIAAHRAARLPYGIADTASSEPSAGN